MPTILKCKRPIKKVYWPDESCLEVGSEHGVDKIEPYHEPGIMITWLAVYRNGHIDQRINTNYIDSIIYS